MTQTKRFEVEQVSANGMSEKLAMPVFTFKQGTKEAEMTAFNQEFYLTATNIRQAENAYCSALPHIARWVNTGYYKNLADSTLNRSPNQLLVNVLHCSKATASYLVRVAKECYTSLGNFNDDFYGALTYSEMVEFTEPKYKEVVEKAKIEYKKRNCKSRADVRAMMSDLMTQAMGIETSGDVKEDVKDVKDPKDAKDAKDAKDVKDANEADTIVELNYKNGMLAIARYIHNMRSNPEKCVEQIENILVEYDIIIE